MMHQRRSDNGFAALSFPCKLYAMLEDAESRGFDHVINWQSGGKSFKVYQPEYFANHVMQDYFAQTKFKSFQRQLNIYGWKKVHHGVNKGGYVHKFFVRGQPDLCNKIARRSNSKDMNNAADRKDLMPLDAVSSDPLTLVFEGEQVIMPPSIAAQEQNVKSDLEESEVDAFYDFFYPSGSSHPAKTHLRQGSLVSSSEPLSLHTPVTGQWRVNAQDLDLKLDADELEGFVTMLHSDDSENSGEAPSYPLAIPKIESPVDEEENEQTGANSGIDSDDELEADHNFPFKLHLMLESAERDNYRHVVSWVKDGKAFKVHNNKEFVAKVLPIYFDQSKYESFRRQLNLYGFQRVARGADRGVISHPCFVEGARYLCKEIKRKQQTKASHPASFAVAIHV